MEIYSLSAGPSRKAMSLPLLKIIGHALASSGLSRFDKASAWAIFCLAFYGSLRMGEILCSHEAFFDAIDSFLWSDIIWSKDDHIILHLRNTKGAKLESVDIFSVPHSSTCPLAALRRLQRLSSASASAPVFSWDSGLFVTIKDINKLLSSLLEPYLGQSSSCISAHSFRAAIPSLLASCPELSSSEEVMGWGRWRSSAYLSYTRLKSDQRRAIFTKILSLFDRRA